MACLKAISLNWEKSIENATPVGKGGGGWRLPMMAIRGSFARKGYLFKASGYERVGIALVKVYKRVGKTVIWVCHKAQKG